MKTIGFATEFYTLWDVSEVYREYVNEHQWYDKQDFVYLQNLSKTLEGAKAKLNGEYAIDLELRGNSSYTSKSEILDNFEDYQFTFGKLIGSDIRTSNDVWQLERAYKSERGEARRNIAMQRLIEFGELVKYEWVDTMGDKRNLNAGKKDENGHSLEPDYEFIPVTKYYATPAQVEIMEANKANLAKQQAENGHFFTNGEKVKLTVTIDKDFSFGTKFGYTTIIIYRDEQNRLFKYMGSSPVYPKVYKEHGNFQDEKGYYNHAYESEILSMVITGTVEHSNYNGQNETKLKRIKIVSFELKQ